MKTEVLTDKVLVGWEEYADLLLLSALVLARKDAPKAKRHLRQAMQMWDGKGLHDRVTEVTGKYATYKLALAVLVANRLRNRHASQQAMLSRLLAQQARDGGWITDYTASGKRAGLANVETTSLAILAIDSALSLGQGAEGVAGQRA